jgi:hypothetical protein
MASSGGESSKGANGVTESSHSSSSIRGGAAVEPAAPSTRASSPGTSPEPAATRDEQRGYSVGNVLSTASSATWRDVTASAGNVSHSACFRTSFLWGAGLGVLFAAHRFKQGGE